MKTSRVRRIRHAAACPRAAVGPYSGGITTLRPPEDAIGACTDDRVAEGHVAVKVEGISADERTMCRLAVVPGRRQWTGVTDHINVEACRVRGFYDTDGACGRRCRGRGGGDRGRVDQRPQERGLAELDAGLAAREPRWHVRGLLEQTAAFELRDRPLNNLIFHPKLAGDLNAGPRAIAAPPNRCRLGRQSVRHVARRVVYDELVPHGLPQQAFGSSLWLTVDVSLQVPRAVSSPAPHSAGRAERTAPT